MDTSARPSVAFFLPAHNEALNLPYVVGEAVDYLNGQCDQFIVIIVDDGSKDETVQVFQQLKMLYADHVRLISHEVNIGYGGALISGLKAGLDSGYPWIVFCDADGQFQPHEAGKLLDRAMANGADVVVGYRTKRADNMFRRVMGRLWHLLSLQIVGYGISDIDCGFKLFSREALLLFADDLVETKAAISPEIMAHIKKHELTVADVGVSHQPRLYGVQSGAQLAVIWASLLGLLRVRQIAGTSVTTLELTPTEKEAA
jgi:glycosyltransferase involved in cell wall biosynthesis